MIKFLGQLSEADLTAYNAGEEVDIGKYLDFYLDEEDENKQKQERRKSDRRAKGKYVVSKNLAGYLQKARDKYK